MGDGRVGEGVEVGIDVAIDIDVATGVDVGIMMLTVDSMVGVGMAEAHPTIITRVNRTKSMNALDVTRLIGVCSTLGRHLSYQGITANYHHRRRAHGCGPIEYLDLSIARAQCQALAIRTEREGVNTGIIRCNGSE